MLLEGILKPAKDRTSIVVIQRVFADGDSVHNFCVAGKTSEHDIEAIS